MSRGRVLGVRFMLALLLGSGGGGLLLSSPTQAQGQAQPVQTQPSQALSSDASGTIGVTNTFQTLWAATSPSGPWRRGCLVVNTSTDLQWVFFGPDGATPSKTGAIPLNPATSAGQLGGWVSCGTGGGSILQDHIWITGTSGDTYVAKQQ